MTMNHVGCMAHKTVQGCVALLALLFVGGAAYVAQGAEQSELFLQLKKEKETLQENLQQVRKDLQHTENQVEQLEKEKQELQARLRKSTHERTDLQRQLAEVADRQQALEEQNEKQAKRIEGLLELVSELRSIVSAQAGAVQAQKGEIKELQSTRERLQSGRREAVHARDRAETRLTNLEQRMQQVKTDIAEQRENMHFNMAVVYQRSGFYEKAVEEYAKVLEFDGDDAETHYNLGILYDDQLRNPEEAAAHYRRFLELKPAGADAEKVRKWLERVEKWQAD